jgi:hypothetical protein
MNGVQQIIVFEARIYPEANQIISGTKLVLLPFRHMPKKVFLFFKNLLPAPLLFEAKIVECHIGSPLALLRLAENKHCSVCSLVPEGLNDASAMLLEFDAELIPMSKEDIVVAAYNRGELPLSE